MKAAPRPARRRLAAWLTAALLLLTACLLVYALRAPLLTGIGRYLIREDELHPADILFLLNGDYNTRPFYAAELYARGLAPRLVIARAEPSPAERLGLLPNETDISVAILERQGVPPQAITVLEIPGGVTSTYDEAVVLRAYVEANAIRRVILVTSAFHTRRAGWIVRQELAGLNVTVELVAARSPDYDETNWWQSEAGLINVNNEYIKLGYYLVTYR
ncbi:MAG: YdcF family protein [Anaerolineales bacterium]